MASASLALAIQFSYNFLTIFVAAHVTNTNTSLALIPAVSHLLLLFFYLLLFLRWQIVRPVNAFLIVDVQNDFISGSLDISNCSAQQQGHEVSTRSRCADEQVELAVGSWGCEAAVTGMRHGACGKRRRKDIKRNKK